MNNMYSLFTIKDLENLSGLKAHTIRIWEHRYQILSPERTSSNVRLYDVSHLKKLLNVVFLNKAGYKISYIATLSESELTAYVHDLILKDNKMEYALNAFKLAMINFDRIHFDAIYSGLLEKNTFRSIFIDVFIPLLSAIGLLWQSNAINPAHEHFISNLIMQKLLIQIERAQQLTKGRSEKTYVLFLPNNEIHELGLLYIHYELILRGFNSIYLGQSVPVDSLPSLNQKETDLIFVSYFTVKPEPDELPAYLKSIDEIVLKSVNYNHSLILFGRQLNDFDQSMLSDNTKIYKSINEFLEKL